MGLECKFDFVLGPILGCILKAKFAQLVAYLIIVIFLH